MGVLGLKFAGDSRASPATCGRGMFGTTDNPEINSRTMLYITWSRSMRSGTTYAASTSRSGLAPAMAAGVADPLWSMEDVTK